MAFVVREPAIVAGRLRLRGEVLSGSDAVEVANNDNLLRSCVEIPDAEASPQVPASKLPAPTEKDSE